MPWVRARVQAWVRLLLLELLLVRMRAWCSSRVASDV